MRTARPSTYLLNYIFLAGLLLLALNDHLWKDLYGNWLTGKLSDVAGVVILPLFLAAVFQLRTWPALLTTVLFFGWWKSPLSQGALDAVNTLGIAHFARVVDYSDYLAFLGLPLSWWVLRSPERFRVGPRGMNPVALTRYGVLPLTLLLFIATSEAYKPVPLRPEITGCCPGFEQNVHLVGNGRIFIPSAFTPDGDGINDVFYVMADTGIARIDLSVFSLERPDTVFAALGVTEFTAANGWDGTELGVIVPKTYEYRARVTADDGTERFFNGGVCSLPCREPTGLPRPSGVGFCQFTDQVDATGFFSDSIRTVEVLDCFE